MDSDLSVLNEAIFSGISNIRSQLCYIKEFISEQLYFNLGSVKGLKTDHEKIPTTVAISK